MFYVLIAIVTALVTMWLTNVLRVRVTRKLQLSFAVQISPPPVVDDVDLKGRFCKFWVERS